MDNQNYMPGIAPENNNDKGNIGWAILGFFFPVMGLVLFLVWKNTRYGDAKNAGIGALVGFIVPFIIPMIIIAIFYFYFQPSIKENMFDQRCKIYGPNYELRITNETWECYDTENGEVIQIPEE